MPQYRFIVPQSTVREDTIPAGTIIDQPTLVGARRAWLVVLALVLCATTCCTRDSAPVSTAEDSASPSAPPSTQPTQSPDSVRETWDVYYIEGAKVGHGRTRCERVTEEGRELVHIQTEQTTSFKRFDQKISQHIELESWELPNGPMVRFQSAVNDATSKITTHGRYHQGELTIDTVTLGKTQTTTLPFDPSWGGFFATEQRLERQPMQPGEKRSFLALVPVFNQVGQFTLETVGREMTEVLGEQRELLRIRAAMQFGPTSIDTVIWTDEKGGIWKTVIPTLNQVIYRTTRDQALAEATNQKEFDLGWRSVVTVKQKLERPHDTREIVYRATLANGDPAREFSNGGSQQVRSLDAHTAEVTVRALRPNEPQQEFGRAPPPTDAERSPNNFLQSDDAAVQRLAQTVAADEADQWKVACALERLVRDTVDAPEQSPAVATAADVAQSHTGDCTEHAVLLAALCRARGIPARVAIGLVYYERSRGFAYHMWTEAWIADRWIPLDGTLGRGGIGAAHLKITHSNLDSSDSLSAFLPVFKLLGQLQLELLSVDGEEPMIAP
jgi:transglutaminase-like putative cysteine protease